MLRDTTPEEVEALRLVIRAEYLAPVQCQMCNMCTCCRTLDRERVETIRLVLRVEDLAAMNSRQTATGR